MDFKDYWSKLMSLKIMQQAFLWKRFKDDSIETYVGAANEPILDLRPGRNTIRLCDGVTPGGHPIESEVTAGVDTPTITSPFNGAVDVDLSPIITSSVFSGIGVDLQPDTHASTTWEIATDSLFTNIVHTSIDDTIDLTSLDLDSHGVTLARGVEHFARVKYTGASGSSSDYSSAVSFTTDNFIGLAFNQDLYINGGTNGVPIDRGEPVILFIDNNTLLFANRQNNDTNINSGKGFVALCKKVNNIWSVDQYIPSIPTHIAYAKTGNRVIISDGAYINFYSYANGTLTYINRIGRSISFGSIDISDDGGVLLLGDGGADDALGKIYVYRWSTNTYILDVSYRPASITSLSRYGFSVSISGDGTKAIVYPLDPHETRPNQYKRIDLLNINPGSVTLNKDITGLYNQQQAVIDSLITSTRKATLNYDGTAFYIVRSGSLEAWSKVGTTWTKTSIATPYPGSVPSGTEISDDGSLLFSAGTHGGTNLGKGTVMQLNGNVWTTVGETESLNRTTHDWGYIGGASPGFTDVAMHIKNPPGSPTGWYLRFYKFIH